MVTVILSIVWVLVLGGIVIAGTGIYTTMSSGKLMKTLEEAERIGGEDFMTDYPAFVNRMKIIKKGAKHPKIYCVERAAKRFQREYKIMQAYEKKKSLRK